MLSNTVSSTAVDLSRLPPPDAVEELDFEALYAAWQADLAALDPELTELDDSDPVAKVMQVGAYRELLIRQRANEAVRAVMVAYAAGTDLENLAAFFGLTRLTVTEADGVTGDPAVLESDTELRRRILLAPDSYSVAGPASAYVFHALSADGDVLDASATSPAPGEVVVSVLSRQGDGTADQPLLEAVEIALDFDTIRPLTDEVTVQSAVLIPVNIRAELTLYAGPDADLILANSVAALNTLIDDNRRLGRDLTRSAMNAALHSGGVQNVNLIEPAESVIVDSTSAFAIGTIDITIAGYDE